MFLITLEIASKMVGKAVYGSRSGRNIGFQAQLALRRVQLFPSPNILPGQMTRVRRDARVIYTTGGSQSLP